LTPNTATGFALRTQMPFIATPVNVMGEVVSRTLLAPFTSSFWSAMKQGGKDADMAMAKIGVSRVCYVWLYSNGYKWRYYRSWPWLVKEHAKQWSAKAGNHTVLCLILVEYQKICVKNFRNILVMSRYGSGDYAGKVFLSFQGMEPTGALMGIAADYVDYARYEEDDSRLNAYAGGMVFGVANYMLSILF